MYIPIYLLSFLLLSLHNTLANPHRLPTTPDTRWGLPSYQKPPQRPISFAPPSQHPLLIPLPASKGSSPIRGTINVSSRGPHLQPISVTYSISPQVCTPLIFEIPYIITDLSQQILSEHLNGTSFPFASNSQTSTLPIYLVANITEQLYRSKFVLSLSLKLSPLESGLKEVETPGWRSIIVLLEQSAQELDRGARNRDGTCLGNALVLEAEAEGVHILAEWRFWRIADGVAVMCHS